MKELWTVILTVIGVIILLLMLAFAFTYAAMRSPIIWLIAVPIDIIVGAIVTWIGIEIIQEF